MYTWRGAITIGIGFVVVGLLYLLLQGSGETSDRSGVVMLVLLGIAMAFTFSILLRGSREL
jgi:hypothetical protein